MIYLNFSIRKKLCLFLMLSCLISNVSGQTNEWIRVGPKGYGKNPATGQKQSASRVGPIRVSYSPSVTNPTIFVSTYIGIFKTTDKGETFTPIANHTSPAWINDMRMSDFAAHPTNAQFLVAAVINGKIQARQRDMRIETNQRGNQKINIYKTLDEGLTWTHISNFDNSVSVSDQPKITFVNKFLFSLNGDTLYAGTNYGLYKCTITASNPVWTRVTNFGYENISDLKYKPGSTTTSWSLYVAGEKIRKKTNSLSWQTITTDTGLFYLAFSNAGNLVAKKSGTGYLYSNHIYDCMYESLSGSYSKDIRTYTLTEYAESGGGVTATLQKTITCADGHLGCETVVDNAFSEDFCPQMASDNNGNIYLGRDVLVKVNTQSAYSTSLESEYDNSYCSATHGDVMDMWFNPSTNELYVNSHGTFGVYNTTSTASWTCQKWNVINQKGLPSSFMKTMASSPFSNGELVYSVWDQIRASFYQVGDIHYGNRQFGNGEHSNPFFFINDKVYISSIKKYNNEADPYIFSNGAESQVYCYEYLPNAYAARSVLSGINIYQIKRGKDTPPGSFYYVDGTSLYYVQNINHAADAVAAFANKETIANINTLGYSGYNLHRFNIIDSKNIILILSKAPVDYNLSWGGTAIFGNRVLRTKDGGNTWTELTSWVTMRDIAYTKDPYTYCHIFNDAIETYIKKFLVDPYNSNKCYVMMGTLQTASNLSTIYYSENGGATWNLVFHQYADMDAGPTFNPYSGVQRPQLNSPVYLQGLPMLSDGTLLPFFEDFDLNPNTGDPILVSEMGVYFKKNGFLANTSWEQLYYSPSVAKVQPRNGRYIDINTAFNKMYVASSGGVFGADIPCYNENATLTLSSFQDGALYQTSTTITSASVVPSTYGLTARAGESITLNPGFSFTGSDKGATFLVGECSYSPMPYTTNRVEPVMVTKLRQELPEDAAEAEEHEEGYGLLVYPNPALRDITIASKKDEIKSIALFSTVGQQLHEVKAVNSHTYQLDLSPYKGEMLLLRVEYGDRIETVKVMKEGLQQDKDQSLKK